jgi:Uma2 family endonuclease
MATATLLTAAEFMDRPDEFDGSGNRIKEELIGGEVVASVTPDWRHDLLKNKVGAALHIYLDARQELGLRAVIAHAFQVAPLDVLTPDVAVFRSQCLASVEGPLLQGAPEIAIEVVSPSDTANDIHRKVNAYLANGAHSVWIFFDDGSVMIHATDQVRAIKNGQPLEDPLLPGFSVPVSAFFAV